MGLSFNLNDEGITVLQDGIILFDCPLERIKHEPKVALYAMREMVELIERYEEALKYISEIKQPDGGYVSRLDVAVTKAKNALND